MFRLYGHSIGDAWYYESRRYRLYVLPHQAGEAGTVGWDIGHAATRDLVDWEFLGLGTDRVERRERGTTRASPLEA